MHNIRKKTNRFLFFSVYIFLFTLCSSASADRSSILPFQIDAKIMDIVSDENVVIVAEKEIFLKSHDEKGKKVWDTRFLDIKDQLIDLDIIKLRDRVLVTGSVDGGKITADEIRLLEPAD